MNKYKLTIGDKTYICNTIYTEEQMAELRSSSKKPIEIHKTEDGKEIKCVLGRAELEFIYQNE